MGVCYGVRLVISVPTASEIFGLKYYGIMYNFLILNLPLGSFLFGLVAGILYDSEAADGQNIMARLYSRNYTLEICGRAPTVLAPTATDWSSW